MQSAQAGYEERIVPGTKAWQHEIAAHSTRYEFAKSFVTGKSVLDAGCGVGYGSKLLADGGARRVTAVDISEEALEIARRQFPHPNLEYLQGDCQNLGHLDDPFDVVIAFESLEHVPRSEQFIAELARLTRRDGGVFLCTTPNREQTAGGGKDRSENPYHLREFSPQEFVSALRESFDRVALLGQHKTAALQGVEQAMGIFWHQPFIRLGRRLQRMLGRGVQRPELIPTPADFVITEINAELAWTLFAVCRDPRRH